MKIKRILICSVVGIVVVTFIRMIWFFYRVVENRIAFAERYRAYYELVNQWMSNKNKNHSLVNFLREKNINKVAVYGNGSLGKLLIHDLQAENMEIVCIVDKGAKEIKTGNQIPIVPLKNTSILSKADILIVTPIADYADVLEDLHENDIQMEIVSLEDVIYENDYSFEDI